jgi:hypothetical protein
MQGKIEPEYVDKIDLENVIELYGLLGLYSAEQTYNIEIENLRNEHDGDATSAICHLRNQGILNVELEEDRLSLNPGERDYAEITSNRLYLEGKTPEELLQQGELPDEIVNYSGQEDFNTPINSIDQVPDEEFYSRIIGALSRNNRLKPGEVEEELLIETTFDIEPKLKYLETQSVVKRTEDNEYVLRDESIDEIFFREELRPVSLKQEQGYGNDPWKF